MRYDVVVAGALVLAGCSAADTPAKTETKVAAKLGAGLYETSAEVTSLASTDKTTPATKLAMGSKTTAQACVGADGVPAPALFAEAGDQCTSQSSYIRNGRISVQLACTRPGHGGNVLVTMDGKFTADEFSGLVQSTTHFNSYGNFSLSRKLSARRVGACPAAKA